MTSRFGRRLATGIGLVILAGLVLAVLERLQHSPELFRYAMAGAALWLAAFSFAVRRCRFVNLALTMTIVVVMIGVLDKVAEVMLSPHRGVVQVTIAPAGYRVYRRDADLGYALVPNDAEDATLTAQDRVIYQAHYGVGPDGLRLTPGGAPADGKGAGTVLFLGDSLTFGEGLNDADTLPAQFARATDRRFTVINAAVSGYGAHQMLREIETGHAAKLLGDGRRVYVYAAIPDHLRRVAGLAEWDLWGPHYVLDGEVSRYAGPFHSNIGGDVLRFGQRSGLFNAGYGVWAASRTALATADPRLWGALVQQAATIASTRDHAELMVLLWESSPGEPGGSTDRMAAELDRRGVPYARVAKLVPEMVGHDDIYAFAFDGHPTPVMNQHLAAALATKF